MDGNMLIQACVSAVPLQILPCWSDSRGSRRPFRGSRMSLSALRAQVGQRAQSRQVVGGHGECQKLVDLVQSMQHHLPDRTDQLPPAEALLDALALALA